MTKKWNVYEYVNGKYLNFIGSVQASTRREAINKAHRVYGAPIKVKSANQSINTVEQ